MSIFRYLMLCLVGGLGSIAAVFFLLYVAQGDDRWMSRARAFGRWCWTVMLFWFNVEIWGQVVWLLINWP